MVNPVVADVFSRLLGAVASRPQLPRTRITGHRMVRGCLAAICVGVFAVANNLYALPSPSGHHAAYLQDGSQDAAADGQTDSQQPDKPVSVEPVDSGRAWEYDPYRVQVWICHDQSNFINAYMDQLIGYLTQQAKLVDKSGWRVQVATPSVSWNWQLISSDDLDSITDKLAAVPEIRNFDKLIAVRIHSQRGRYAIQTRELDIRTLTWGADNKLDVSNRADLRQAVTSSVFNAFMPIARIDKVDRKEVRLRVRASRLVKKLVKDDQGNFKLEPNRESPVWVKRQDVFLPVIRRTDRSGKLEGVTRVPWTFLTIVSRNENDLLCTTHATARAPLAGRKGRQTQYFALVIRPPRQPTLLTITSNSKEDPRPLPGLEILSREPDAPLGSPTTYIGETDWRGQILIEPGNHPLRVLGVKSGSSMLARLPVVPGLYDELTTRMLDDEKRLYAEGVAQGLVNELLDVVAHRAVINIEIDKFLEKGEFDRAREKLRELRGLDDAASFIARLNTERKRLQTGTSRENAKIQAMFADLEGMAKLHLDSAIVVNADLKIETARQGGDWRSVTVSGVKKTEEETVTEEDVVQEEAVMSDPSTGIKIDIPEDAVIDPD